VKHREQVKQIRAAKKWYHKMMIAEGQVHGTDYDGLFREAIAAVNLSEGLPPEEVDKHTKDFFAAIGEDFARAFRGRNSSLFRRIADALDVWKVRPEPDPLRAAVLWACIPPDRPHAIQDVIAKVRVKGFQNSERQIRSLCKELGLQIKSPMGAPKKVGQKNAKEGEL